MWQWVEEKRVQQHNRSPIYGYNGMLYWRMWWFVTIAGPKNVFYHSEIGARLPRLQSAYGMFRGKTWTISRSIWLARSFQFYIIVIWGYFYVHAPYLPKYQQRPTSNINHNNVSTAMALAIISLIARSMLNSLYDLSKFRSFLLCIAHKHWECDTLWWWSRSLWHSFFIMLSV